jgi:hypothetical protein
MHTDIHASSGIQTHDPSVRVGGDGSCLKPRGQCDQLHNDLHNYNYIVKDMHHGKVTCRVLKKFNCHNKDKNAAFINWYIVLHNAQYKTVLDHPSLLVL